MESSNGRAALDSRGCLPPVAAQAGGVWDIHEDLRPEGYSPEIQRRVFVMSLAGEALQTYAPELEGGQRLSDNMAVFGENLVLKVGGESKLIALKGL